MKLSVGKQKLILYGCLSLAYLGMWIAHELLDDPRDAITKIINLTWRMPFVAVVNFLFFEKVLPFVSKKRKYAAITTLLIVLSLIVLFVFYSFGSYAWRNIGIAVHIYRPLIEFDSLIKGVAASTGVATGSFFLFGIVSYIYKYLQLRNTTQQLLIEKQQAELNFLKSQTNPHFLFNTLNNIYSLTIHRPDLAPESVLRLSKILRFMLYEASVPFVPVAHDVSIIQDYIDLEKLRYDETLRINFTQEIADAKRLIPPLLLMPLVENAFKHGISESVGERFIDMHLSIRDNQLEFVIRNPVDADASPAGGSKENIGLSNLRRQLELLYKKYRLSATAKENVFTATLQINLDSHV